MKLKIKTLEYSIIYITGILLLISLIILGNITSFQLNFSFFIKQVMWILVSSIAFWICWKKINIQKIRISAFPLVLIGLLLLIAVLIPGIGKTVNFSRRWISLKIFNLQVSTVARLILIFYLAHYFAKNREKAENSTALNFLKAYFPVILISLLYMSLIFVEPDLSTSAILFLLFLTIIFLANIKLSTILLLGLIAIILLIAIFTYGPQYRKERFFAFQKFISREEISPEYEEKFWQPKQSLIALSQGKWTGKGSFNDRAKLFYLPFAKTDYIFSIIGEEYGFVGCSVIIFLYLSLVLLIFSLAIRNSDLFSSFLIAAIAFNLVYNIIINLAVVTSLIPSTGVSLPFISYGGTALFIDVISIAIVVNLSDAEVVKIQNEGFRYA